ncbi:MAG: hypothetical protein ACK42E_00240 [Candidatus Bipolaricaulaceae bacterium]
MARRIVVLIFAFSGLVFGQTLSGSWSAKVSLLPPPVALDSLEFTLQGKLFDWTVGGRAEFFGTDGWVWQTFFAQGWLGPVSSEWTLLFGPLAPSFLYAYGKYGLLFTGIDLALHTAMVGPNGPYTFTGGPSGGAVLEFSQKLNGLKLSGELGFGARKQDFVILYSGVGTYKKILPVDPFPGGLTFTYLKLGLEGVPLCCGVTMDLGFSFTKEGFESLTATAKSIPLCCGISFDTEVEFTTTAKTVSVRPKWAGIEGCLTVYGDAVFSGNAWQGIAVYGFKVRCDLGDCTYVEFLTALNVAKVEEILEEDLFQNTEFERIKLGFCGPGCCGDNWTLDVGLFFKPSGSLFGLSRVLLDATIPVMANLQVELGLAAVVGGPAGLTVGWTFTF